MRTRQYILVMLVGLFASCQYGKKKSEENPDAALIAKRPEHAINSQVMQITGPWSDNKHTTTPNLISEGKKLYLSWVERDSTQAYLRYSVNEDDVWGSEDLIAQGNNWFINWADFPQIAVYGDYMMATFLQMSADGTYTYDIYFTIKEGQNPWKAPKKLHRDDTKSEHGFVSISPGSEGFLASWLDGRNTVVEKQSLHNTQNNHGEHSVGAMTLRSVLVNFDGSLGSESLIDSRVCDCCQTAIALAENDEAFVAYRGRSDSEVRDILLRRGHPEEGWTDPMSTDDNWLIPGCPVNGPSIDTYEKTVALAWFTAAENEPRVLVTFSSTDSLALNETIRMDSGNAIGRVDLVQLSSDTAIVSWVEPMGDSDYIRGQWVNKNGEKGPLVTISKTSAERATGFPRMVKHKENLYLVTTQLKPDKSSEISLRAWPISIMLPEQINALKIND